MGLQWFAVWRTLAFTRFRKPDANAVSARDADHIIAQRPSVVALIGLLFVALQ